MKKETSQGDKFLREFSRICTALSLLVTVGLLFADFTPKAQKQIKERSKGYCEGCGKYVGIENLIAGHIKHKWQNSNPNNGKAFCLLCETRYHVSHLGHDSFKIGLRRRENSSNAWLRYSSLSDDEKATLEAEFPEQVRRLHEMFGKKSSK